MLPKGILLLFITVITTISAQQKDITLEDIWSNGTFRTERLDALRSLNNGAEYSVLNFDRSNRSSSIDVYDYKSGDKIKTLFDSGSVKRFDLIYTYEFSTDESKLLLATELDQIYRRSSEGTYFVYDINSKELTLVSTDKIQEPTFSPDGTKIAYGFQNNLYVKELSSGSVKQITKDGAKNRIINGITDWVYEEEFGFVRAFDWNKNSDKIAFIRFDETNVPQYSMDIMGQELYPSQQVFKYPKAGEENAKVSLHLYDLAKESISNIDLSSYNNYYMPRIKWTSDAAVLSVQLMNRHQNTLDLVFVNASEETSELILQETDNAYVDVRDDLTFLNNNSFIWTSEKSGWNHIYQYDKTGTLKNQITNGSWEVTSYYGFDENTGRIYYQSTENGSINRDVYSVLKSGKNKVRLSEGTGSNRASFSKDFTYYINTFSNAETPNVFTLHKAKTGKLLREIKNNEAVKNKLKGYKVSPKEFSTIAINGFDLNMY
ncbi:MAG: dipeptidyl-peptidase-4, partial [Flavobacteriaceae bacterium]